MSPKTRKPAWQARSRPGGRRPLPVHAWRNRIAVAFALPERAPDPETLAVTGVLRDLKTRNQATLSALRTDLATGRTPAPAIARALTVEAERCVQTALSLALASTRRRHGPPPGRCAVIALGKFGGRELSFGSDLDVIFVFERGGGDYCPLTAAYFEDVARGVVAALSCHAELGVLYEIDMRLRPHGDDGVLAVELSAFRSYYFETCWTWELQAITRAQVVAGCETLGARILQAARAAIDHGLGLSAGERLDEVLDMRGLLDEERPAATVWDVKRAEGGLLDIEFIAQGLQLVAGAAQSPLPHPSTPEALARLAACGRLGAEDAGALIASWSLQFLILQHQRALGVEPTVLIDQPRRRLEALLNEAGAASVEALRRRLADAQRATRKRLRRLLGKAAPARMAA
jgi:glutamate-ammonia-ligase adenylyltransferase